MKGYRYLLMQLSICLPSYEGNSRFTVKDKAYALSMGIVFTGSLAIMALDTKNPLKVPFIKKTPPPPNTLQLLGDLKDPPTFKQKKTIGRQPPRKKKPIPYTKKIALKPLEKRKEKDFLYKLNLYTNPDTAPFLKEMNKKIIDNLKEKNEKICSEVAVEKEKNTRSNRGGAGYFNVFGYFFTRNEPVSEIPNELSLQLEKHKKETLDLLDKGFLRFLEARKRFLKQKKTPPKEKEAINYLIGFYRAIASYATCEPKATDLLSDSPPLVESIDSGPESSSEPFTLEETRTLPEQPNTSIKKEEEEEMEDSTEEEAEEDEEEDIYSDYVSDFQSQEGEDLGGDFDPEDLNLD